MPILATDTGGGDFKPVPQGNHRAICCTVVDLGDQLIRSPQFGDSVKHQVYIAWELPDEDPITWTDKDTNEEKTGPMRIGRTYTLSLHENANLTADLESWRGRGFTEEEKQGFDVANLAGVPCMVNVIHEENNGKTYANVKGVTPLPKAMDKPELSAPAIVYDGAPAVFEELPKWMREKISSGGSNAHAQIHNNQDGMGTKTENPGAFDDDLDDDVPF